MSRPAQPQLQRVSNPVRTFLSKWKATVSYWSLTSTTHLVEAARDKKSPIILQTSQVRRQVEAYLRLE